MSTEKTPFPRRTPSLVLAALAAVAALLSACGGSGSGAGSAPTPARAQVAPPAAIRSAGQIDFCSDMTFPPQEFMQGTTPVGADIEIGDAIAGELGVKAQWTQVGFDGIVAALLGRKCDAILSSMADTPDRRKQLAFVDYERVGQAILVQRGNPKHINGLADLAGKTVAVQTGTSDATTLDQFNAQHAGGPKIALQLFAKDTDAAAALRTGRVDAYFSDAPPVAFYVKQSPSTFQIAGGQINAVPWGIGVRKDDAALQTALRAAVARLHDDGAIGAALRKWELAAVATPMDGRAP